jgi:hypothetical protein
MYSAIKNCTNDFDRNFDNTVVDTYAFDKALHSEVFTMFLCLQFAKANQKCEVDFYNIKNAATNFLIQEVKNIYQKTDHQILQTDVYYDYIDHLVSEIIAA